MDGNDTYYAAMMELGRFIINLSYIWFIVYVPLGSLVKVGLIRFMNKDLEPCSRRFWPVLLAHFIFSILFVNPYTLFMIVGNLMDISSARLKTIITLLFPLIYWIILPVLLDILFLRILPKTKLFRWLLWTPPLKQVIIINVVICLVSFIAAAWVARVL
jgi:hypothetical protein